MTLEDLQHIFRFQTTATEDYVPLDTVDYVLFEGQNRLVKTHVTKDLGTLLPLLDNFILDGYRDKTPLFVKPESVL